MTEERIREIIAGVASGRTSAAAAFSQLKHLPFEDLGFAKLDGHRTIRRGIPEVVFGESKSVEQIAAIGARAVKAGINLIITRVDADKARALKRKLKRLKYYPDGRIATMRAFWPPAPPTCRWRKRPLSAPSCSATRSPGYTTSASRGSIV